MGLIEEDFEEFVRRIGMNLPRFKTPVKTLSALDIVSVQPMTDSAYHIWVEKYRTKVWNGQKLIVPAGYGPPKAINFGPFSAEPFQVPLDLLEISPESFESTPVIPQPKPKKLEPDVNPKVNKNNPDSWPPCYVCLKYKTALLSPISRVPVCPSCVASLFADGNAST